MVIPLRQPITVKNAEASYRELRDEVLDKKDDVQFDLSGLEEFDSAGLAVFHRLHTELQREGRRLTFTNVSDRVKSLLDLTRFEELREDLEKEAPPNELERIGYYAMDFVRDTRTLLGYIGRVTIALIWSLGHPKKIRFRDVLRYVQETGADALPIVALLSGLVGLVIAFSSAIQLEQFGANIFIVDLIGVGVTREIGPLMAAILLIARSGSAFAAEIGTQKISEEIDALEVMGLKPIPVLVIPRMIATMITLPMLTLFADFFGIIGGMVIASASLNIGPLVFIDRLQESVSIWDTYSGVLKSVFFAILIAGVGCYRGMETSGGAMGVGRSTTSSVVSGIFLLVVADSVFVILFHYLGLSI